MPDKQILELQGATLDILNSGKDLAFIVQIEGYFEDFKVAPDILISYLAQHILQQTQAPTSSFKGLVTDLSLNPVNPNSGDKWLAVLPGLYQYFGGKTLAKSIGIFSYNGISWSLAQQDITGISSNPGTGGGGVTVGNGVEKDIVLLDNATSITYEMNAARLAKFGDNLSYLTFNGYDLNGDPIIPSYKYVNGVLQIGFRPQGQSGVLAITGPAAGSTAKDSMTLVPGNNNFALTADRIAKFGTVPGFITFRAIDGNGDLVFPSIKYNNDSIDIYVDASCTLFATGPGPAAGGSVIRAPFKIEAKDSLVVTWDAAMVSVYGPDPRLINPWLWWDNPDTGLEELRYLTPSINKAQAPLSLTFQFGQTINGILYLA